MPILSLENVSFSYDKQISVLKDLTLSVNEGEYIAVIGHNGSGKSTLAKLLNGLIKPQSGCVLVDGLSTSEKKDIFEIRKKVGLVFQNPDNQLVASIVEDDVAFGPENIGLDREEIGKRIEFALSAVGMQEYRDASPERLSGGQKQRVAIAGVLALKPQVLVLDESTAMLDPQGRKEVLEVVKKLNKEQKTTVIAVTHYMDEIIDADRVIVLHKGQVACMGTPSEVFSQKENLKEWGLELPLVTQIALKIKEKGVDINTQILTKERLVEELCALK